MPWDVVQWFFYNNVSYCENVDDNMVEVFKAISFLVTQPYNYNEVREPIQQWLHIKRDFTAQIDNSQGYKKLEKSNLSSNSWIVTADGGHCHGARYGLGEEKYVVQEFGM